VLTAANAGALCANTDLIQGRMPRITGRLTSKKKLGADHPDTLTAMNNLAFTRKGIGKVDEAVLLIEGCVQLQQCVLGFDYPNTLSTSRALAI